ncbi:cytochrome c peroxidase [uncultured Tateyamaria sp.]|uniref:cytochrome-c peroxidase n=1 Tax=Tateyamaria sp. 1078 TaxID=3417464 RepID=UPI002632FCF0|nr:cytochrome c peroxidase [uncultured Tateyamaria sp.]
MTRLLPNWSFIGVVLVLSCATTALDVARADTRLPAPLTDADFLYDGRPTGALVDLGRTLFFDPILSGNRNISCGTCHDPALASGDGLALGIGEGGTGAGSRRTTRDPVTGRVPRNAQALWNIGARAYVSMFHDGRVERSADGHGFDTPAGDDLPGGVSNLLAAQAFFPVTSPIEMAGQYGENPVADAAATEDRLRVWELLAERVAHTPGYVDMMFDAFPMLRARDEISFVHIAEALAAFQTVAFRSDTAPFDDVLRTGDVSLLSRDAVQGLSLFYGKAGCANCHSGPLFTDHGFHAIGMPQIGPGKGHGADLSYFHDTGLPARQEDEGRYRVTLDDADLFAFRTPSLRNVALTGPWGHSGAYESLEAAIRHHLDPAGSLMGFDPDTVVLPELGQVLRLTGRGTDLGFEVLAPSRRQDFDLRDTRVMTTHQLRARILKANQLVPRTLSDNEIERLVAFLHTLTDPAAARLPDQRPKSVPSGLAVEPPL